MPLLLFIISLLFSVLFLAPFLESVQDIPALSSTKFFFKYNLNNYTSANCLREPVATMVRFLNTD